MSEHELLEKSALQSQESLDILKDNPLVAFAKSAYSFPHDWWLAIHWLIGLQGTYGEDVKQTCIRIGRDLDIMISLGIRTSPQVYQVTAIALDYIISGNATNCPPIRAALQNIDWKNAGYETLNGVSGFTGRLAGGVFTLYASTGGRFGKLARQSPQKTGFILSNTMLATIGALIKLSIKTRGRGYSLIEIWTAILTGEAKKGLSNRQYRNLFEAVQHCKIPINLSDKMAFDKLHEDLAEAVKQA